MTATLETLVIAGYVFACELQTPRPLGRPPEVSDEELVALAVAQATTGICSDRQFLGMVGKLLPGFFPRLPSQSQYNRRLRALTPKLVWVQQRLSALLPCGTLRLADGTLLGVANYAGCQHRSEFAGHAAYGYCPSKSRFYWGMRLVLVTDAQGLPLGYTLVSANEKEYEPVRELTTSQAGSTLIADKGLWGPRVRRDAPPAGRHDPYSCPRAHGGKRRGRAFARGAAARRRVDLLEPQVPDAARAAPRQDARGARAADRPATARAHPRHAPQRHARTSTTEPRRL